MTQLLFLLCTSQVVPRASWKSWAVEPEGISVNSGGDGCEFTLAREILEYVGHRVMLGPRQQTSFRTYFLSVLLGDSFSSEVGFRIRSYSFTLFSSLSFPPLRKGNSHVR